MRVTSVPFFSHDVFYIQDSFCHFDHLSPANALNLDWSKISPSGIELKPFTPQILIFTHQKQTAFENSVGKEEIARNEQFLLFPQCFLLNQKIVSLLVNIFDIISLFAA